MAPEVVLLKCIVGNVGSKFLYTWTDKGDLSGSTVWMLIINCFQTVSNEYNSVIATLDEWTAVSKPANYITHNATPLPYISKGNKSPLFP